MGEADKLKGMTPGVRFAKRAVDVLGSIVGLAVAAPLFPLIAAAIYLDSPGPVIFRQRRAGELIGPDGPVEQTGRFRFHEFEMLKFRTMRPNAEKNTGAILAQQDDPRITRVGKFLRKSRLDELPQFINVLRGEMSLVGPRPERPELLENLALAIPFFEERMRNVKPGITGLAQISLGYSGSAPDGSPINEFKEALTNPFKLEGADDAEADDMRMKMLFDLAYSANLEGLATYLVMEAKIIFKTPLVMIRGVGR
jgi:lipopolysaccharide/colanic/teichoic acid biosynthesis glycosyltransferase